MSSPKFGASTFPLPGTLSFPARQVHRREAAEGRGRPRGGPRGRRGPDFWQIFGKFFWQNFRRFRLYRHRSLQENTRFAAFSKSTRLSS